MGGVPAAAGRLSVAQQGVQQGADDLQAAV
jgi:hypothetical protein